jgi:hypothetical protein
VKKIFIIAIAAIVFTACAHQRKLYKSNGYFYRDANGNYVFKQLTSWQPFTPGNTPCDTVPMILQTSKKPKQ